MLTDEKCFHVENMQNTPRISTGVPDNSRVNRGRLLAGSSSPAEVNKIPERKQSSTSEPPPSFSRREFRFDGVLLRLPLGVRTSESENSRFCLELWASPEFKPPIKELVVHLPATMHSDSRENRGLYVVSNFPLSDLRQKSSIHDAIREDRKIETKFTFTDLVTETDKRAEKFLIGKLSQRFLNHSRLFDNLYESDGW